MNTHNVLTIGDGMITMNPMTSGPLRFVSSFERKVGGAELNFAIACARLGLNPIWISRVGKDEFGRFVHNFARGEGVDTSYVKLMDGYTTPVNFKEILGDGSGSTFYYRSDSPILTLTNDDIKEHLFEHVSLIHLTGVYMAVSKDNMDVINKIIKIAEQKRIPISFDPNIRLKIWDLTSAKKCFNNIFPHVDILLTGLDEIELITGYSNELELGNFSDENRLTELVIKDGVNGAKLYKESTWYYQESFPVNVIDTVGAGDGFDAGYIHGFLSGNSELERLKFANAVGALVTTVSGDNEGLPYYEEVMNFLNNDTMVER